MKRGAVQRRSYAFMTTLLSERIYYTFTKNFAQVKNNITDGMEAIMLIIPCRPGDVTAAIRLCDIGVTAKKKKKLPLVIPPSFREKSCEFSSDPNQQAHTEYRPASENSDNFSMTRVPLMQRGRRLYAPVRWVPMSGGNVRC